MSEARRRAYLEALDIPVWIGRAHDEAIGLSGIVQIRLGPGSGALLVVCDSQESPAAVIASDIARAVDEAPVWGWPSPDEAGQPIMAVVEEHLFTRVLVLGDALARGLFGTAPPERLGQARVVVADDLATLARAPEARRRLWQRLCNGGLVTGR